MFSSCWGGILPRKQSRRLAQRTEVCIKSHEFQIPCPAQRAMYLSETLKGPAKRVQVPDWARCSVSKSVTSTLIVAGPLAIVPLFVGPPRLSPGVRFRSNTFYTQSFIIKSSTTEIKGGSKTSIRDSDAHVDVIWRRQKGNGRTKDSVYGEASRGREPGCCHVGAGGLTCHTDIAVAFKARYRR